MPCLDVVLTGGYVFRKYVGGICVQKITSTSQTLAVPAILSVVYSLNKYYKGHVKIILLPVIALSYPFVCSKLEQTLHKQQEQHS